MFCDRCGANLQGPVSFCPHCGRQFGAAPPPLFAALGVEVAAEPTIMKEKHLRITVRQNGRSLVLKAWNLAHRARELAPGARVDVAFNLEDDAYSAARGYPPWAAILKDFRPA